MDLGVGIRVLHTKSAEKDGALEMAKEFRANGRYYCYNMVTPNWFLPENHYAAGIPGQKLILLWYNMNYVIKNP